MKFHCQTLHNHSDVDVSKYVISHRPLKVSHNLNFCSNKYIVAQSITVPTNDL